jgi:small subunit ribosomal protein S36
VTTPGPARVPAVVWAITGLHTALLLVYGVLYPAHLGYDEPQHVDMVVALLSGDGWPGPGERILSEGVYRSSDALYDAGGVPDSPYPDGDLLALEQPYRLGDFGVRGERPSLEDLGGNAPSEYFPPNQIVQHPPMWHATGAFVLAVLPGSERWPYDVTVGALRLVSVLMVAPLPLLAWAVARRLVPDPVVANAAAALTLAIPGLTRVGASAGNDALVVLSFAAVLVALARVVTGDTSRRTAVATGALVSLALLTKGFGLILPVVVVAAYGLAWRRQRSSAVLASAAVALAVSGVGMLWWLRNVVVYGALQPRGYGPEATAILRGTPRPPGAEVPVTPFLRQFYETTSSRFWSGLGVPEPPTFPVPVSTALTVLTGFGVLLALVAGVRSTRDAHDVRPAIAVLLLPVALLLGPLVWADLQSYRTYESSVGEIGVQGRYLYGGVAGVAVAVAVGYRRLLPRGRWPVTLALGAALVLQVYALHLVTQQFWVPRGAGLGGLDEGFAVLFDAAAWPRVVTALPFLAAAVLAVVSLVLTLARPAQVDAAPARPALDARL